MDQYIADTWTTLTRSPLNCAALVDAKLPPNDSTLYLPAGEPITPQIREAVTECKVGVAHLPKGATIGHFDPNTLPHPGLLYLPNPYVVPGGRFNEMYGWDSYFIVEGLLLDHRVPLARGMTENFFYQLDHYGAVLNANRTYYLTRSQPPFLTSMILTVANHLPPNERHDWLERGYKAAKIDWNYWDQPALRAGDTGLSRYFDFGHGPVPEMHDDPAYYDDVISHLLKLGDKGKRFLRKATDEDEDRHLPTLLDHPGGTLYTLTDDFYLGDRADRASGFDVTDRFGPFAGLTHHFAPVCLNSLLYKEETDLVQIATDLGHPDEAKEWQQRADARKAAINKYLWDDHAGMFFDYDFTTRQRSTYKYVTTFYPLWAKLASPDQAAKLATHLHDFLLPGGLAPSPYNTGLQWDAPFAWAPLQFLTITGLRNYGFTHQADDISRRWLSMVQENFQKEHTLREKYNAKTRTPDIPLKAGYVQNVLGFGWTNATILKLQKELAHQ